ncbi:MAG: hypothetical protein RL518_2225 [Pseudomonadota bacterium]|jgi:phytoene desaturase
MKAVVVGTGFESLASALQLRALGYEVDVLEEGTAPGEWARGFFHQGDTLEVVPPTISCPWLFDELFDLFQERRPDFIEFTPSPLYRRNLYADGTRLDIVSSVEQQELEIGSIAPEDAKRYRGFLKQCEELYTKDIDQGHRDTSIDLKRLLHTMPSRVAPKVFSNLWRCTGRYFGDRRVRQAFAWPAFTTGLHPFVAPARAIAMHAIERRGGVWVVQGGTSKLVSALVNLGERHGIRFHYDHKVVSVSRDGTGKIVSLYSAHRGERVVIPCELVVWSSASQSLHQAFGGDDLSPIERIALRPIQPSFGMYVLFLKTKRSYPEVADQTVVFSERWEGLLSQIGKGPRLPKDPIFAVCRLSGTALRGPHEEGELFSVFVPVPHLGRYSGWKFDGTGFKDIILTKLRERVLPTLKCTQVFAESIDPRYARDVLSHPHGAPFPLATTISLTGGLSFQHRMHRIPNLFLSGGGFQGIGGISGAVTSGRLIAEMVRQDFPATYPYEPPASIAARWVG